MYRQIHLLVNAKKNLCVIFYLSYFKNRLISMCIFYGSTEIKLDVLHILA